MKRVTIMILLTFITVFAALSQEETLLGEEKIEHGGYGGPVMKVTSVNGDAAILVGGKCAWIINHTVALGFAGYGLASDINARDISLYGERYVGMGYGGFNVEIMLHSDRLINFSVETLIGGGAVGYRNELMYNDHSDRNYDGIFVLEPGANVNLNVTKWFRASVGGSYRYVSGVTTGSTTNADLRGAAGALTLRFGKF